jgi:hypothetical protein
MSETVLAHIAAAISQKENLATEALAFIINRSSAAQIALSSEISRLSESTTSIARVATQVAVSAESRPDVLLLDEKGTLLGYIEAKFWAALTASQPVEYVRRLREAGSTVLVMLAPANRLPTLRFEVIERCAAAGLKAESRSESLLQIDSVSLCLLSWQRLLDLLAAGVVADPAASSDVRQLAGLCARFESEGFLPLSREELEERDLPRRVTSLALLIDPIVDLATNRGIVSTKGLRATHSLGRFGRYVAFSHAGSWFGISFWGWKDKGRGPFWMTFAPDAWGRANQLRAALRDWASEQPPRAYIDDSDGVIRVPLLLRAGVEREAVIEGVVQQLTALDAKLRAAGLAPLGATPPASDPSDGA